MYYNQIFTNFDSCSDYYKDLTFIPYEMFYSQTLNNYDPCYKISKKFLKRQIFVINIL